MAKSDFHAVIGRVLGNEGGYVNHPSDPGGETKWGISKRSYPDVDIASLTKEQAIEIYKRDYWDRLGADNFDPVVAFQVLDAAVNHGIGTAIRMLQRAIGVADDGHFGPASRHALDMCSTWDVAMRFNAERLEFYTKLSGWSTFGRGWSKRIADNLRLAALDC